MSSTLQVPSVSPREAQSYYFGICPSPPTLLYRSDLLTKPWVRPKPGAWPTLKRIVGVYNHKLVDVWESDVAPQIARILKTRGVPWTSVDVSRFVTKDGTVGGKEVKGPVVIWVGVHPTRGETPNRAEQLFKSSNDISDFLESLDIVDATIEYRDSVHTHLRGPSLLPYVPYPDLDPTADIRIPLTPTLGLAICSQEALSEGTLALYFAEGGTSNAILGLTCHHVLSHGNKPSIATDGGENIQLLGPCAFDRLLKNLRSSISQLQVDARHYQNRINSLRNATEYNNVELQKLRHTLETKSATTTAAVQELQQFLVDVEKYWGEPKQRVIGHIRGSPESDMHDRAEDWGVFEIDQAKFRETFKGNVIDLGHADFKYPLDRLIPLCDIMSKEAICKPATFGSNQLPLESHFVIKRGAASGVTIGRASGILSMVYDEDNETESFKWAIFNYDGYSPFCGPGDSGSVIVDGQGRIGGMLTASVSKGGLSSVSFITYAIPMYRLWKEVRKSFPDAHLSPTIDV
ncbi:hypothetical protein ONZ45_g19614 [Pleurotus djamor]|nr:hypothetical protein ONZ45_g19614 [Pleurotus djamor]